MYLYICIDVCYIYISIYDIYVCYVCICNNMVEPLTDIYIAILLLISIYIVILVLL